MNSWLKSTWIAAATSALAIAQVASAQPADDQLIGIWVSETVFGPDVHGELTVVREGTDWRAALSGTELHSARYSPAFVFPGTRALFNGSLSEDESAINGFWFQPSSVTAE